MISAPDKLYDILAGASAVTAIVGDKIHKTHVPDGVKAPAISFRRSNTGYTGVVHSGRPVIGQVTFEIVCVAESDTVAEQLGDAVEAISGFSRFLDRIDIYDEETELYANIVTVSVSVT